MGGNLEGGRGGKKPHTPLPPWEKGELSGEESTKNVQMGESHIRHPTEGGKGRGDGDKSYGEARWERRRPDNCRQQGASLGNRKMLVEKGKAKKGESKKKRQIENPLGSDGLRGWSVRHGEGRSTIQREGIRKKKRDARRGT